MLDDSVKFLYEIVKIYIKRLKSNPRLVLLRIDNVDIGSLCLTFRCATENIFDLGKKVDGLNNEKNILIRNNSLGPCL